MFRCFLFLLGLLSFFPAWGGGKDCYRLLEEKPFPYRYRLGVRPPSIQDHVEKRILDLIDLDLARMAEVGDDKRLAEIISILADENISQIVSLGFVKRIAHRIYRFYRLEGDASRYANIFGPLWKLLEVQEQRDVLESLRTIVKDSDLILSTRAKAWVGMIPEELSLSAELWESLRLFNRFSKQDRPFFLKALYREEKKGLALNLFINRELASSKGRVQRVQRFLKNLLPPLHDVEGWFPLFVRLESGFSIPARYRSSPLFAQTSKSIVLGGENEEGSLIGWFHKNGDLKREFQEKMGWSRGFWSVSPGSGLRGRVVGDERVVVSEDGKGLVYMFDKEGTKIGRIETDGRLYTPMRIGDGPLSLVVSEEGTVYILGLEGNVINRFKLDSGLREVSFSPMRGGHNGVIIQAAKGAEQKGVTTFFYFVNEVGMLSNQVRLEGSSLAAPTDSGIAVLSGSRVSYFDQYGLSRDRIDLEHEGGYKEGGDTPIVFSLAQDEGPVVGFASGKVVFFDRKGKNRVQIKTEGVAVYGPLVMPDGGVVMVTNEDYIYFFNEKGVLRSRARMGGLISSPPVFVGDNVVIASDDGYLSFFDTKGKIRHRAGSGRGHRMEILNVEDSVITVRATVANSWPSPEEGHLLFLKVDEIEDIVEAP